MGGCGCVDVWVSGWGRWLGRLVVVGVSGVVQVGLGLDGGGWMELGVCVWLGWVRGWAFSSAGGASEPAAALGEFVKSGWAL